MTEKAAVGMIGLGVMGANLARNLERNGFACAVYNRTTSVTTEFMERFGSGHLFYAEATLPDFVQRIAAPRKIFLMVQAGSAVDAVLASLLPLLSPGDVVIDGGNTYYTDTEKRETLCSKAGVVFVGAGISGGETGALNGPSIMPGGAPEGWKIIGPILEKISAKVDGQACTTHIGPGGSGHFVKMVHNGIEYADMQLIAEAYDVLSVVAGVGPQQLAQVFADWNKGDLSSYLIEITAKIFNKSDSAGGYLVDKILDRAGQKGTGKWTVQLALDLGVAVPTIAAAVDARVLSAQREMRSMGAEIFNEQPMSTKPTKELIDAVRDALYAAKVVAYAQGVQLILAASTSKCWNLKIDSIASIWRGGCIIRAALLEKIRQAYSQTSAPSSLLFAAGFSNDLKRVIPALRKVVALAASSGISLPAFSSALAYFESSRRARLPQNLIQAQRDFFGAHTYERIDQPGSFHTEWES